MFDFFDIVREFLDRGGQVLWLILFTTMLLWTLIAERFFFFRKDYVEMKDKAAEKWNMREDKTSWAAKRIRETKVAQMGTEISRNINVIKTLVLLCPLLGLLGTVTGMIAVFDVMAETGTGNARLMASGISMATIPTMAGMVAALSGIYFGSVLEKRAEKEKQNYAELLAVD